MTRFGHTAWVKEKFPYFPNTAAFNVICDGSLIIANTESFICIVLNFMHCHTKERKRKNRLFTTATLTAKIGQSCKNRYEYEFEFAVQSLLCCPRCCLYVVIRSFVSLLGLASGNIPYKITLQLTRHTHKQYNKTKINEAKMTLLSLRTNWLIDHSRKYHNIP